jgi:hypothetical protein
MLTIVGERKTCQLCRERTESEGSAGKPQRYQMSHISAEGIKRFASILTFMVVFGWLGLRLIISSLIPTPKSLVDTQQPWARKALTAWPTIAVELRPDKPTEEQPTEVLGPNAALIRRPDGSLVAATAVSFYEVRDEDPDATPMPRYDDFAKRFTGVRPSIGTDTGAPWTNLDSASRELFEQRVVFLAPPSVLAAAGCQPLDLRGPPIIPGVRLSVAVATDAKQHRQVVLPAIVASANMEGDLKALLDDQPYAIAHGSAGSSCVIRLDTAYAADALTGAPVVDNRGNLAAIILEPMSPRDMNGRTTDFVACGVESLRRALAPAKGK